MIHLRTILDTYYKMRLWFAAKRFLEHARMHVVMSFVQDGVIKTMSKIRASLGRSGTTKKAGNSVQ